MSSIKKTTHLPVAVPAALVLLSFCGSAVAQQLFEEITVTATKRETTIQDVPFSINAQTARDIQRSGATDLEELRALQYRTSVLDKARLLFAVCRPDRSFATSRA